MPNLTLSNEQVIELVKQLPEAQQQEVYKILILSQWRQLEPVFNEGAERARIVAKERGYDWNTRFFLGQHHLIRSLSLPLLINFFFLYILFSVFLQN